MNGTGVTVGTGEGDAAIATGVASTTVGVTANGFAGMAGSLYVSVQRFVSPGDAGFEIAALALLAVIIGGVGSMWGACVGAAVVILTRDYLGGYVAGRASLLLGILFVAAVYLLPRGIAGVRARWPVRARAGAQA